MNCLNPDWKYLSLNQEEYDGKQYVSQVLHKEKPILKNYYEKFFKDDIVECSPFFTSNSVEEIMDGVFNDSLLKNKDYILYSIEANNLKEVTEFEKDII